MGLDVISSGEPTYWPSDRQKIPDVIDFGVTKNISRELVDVEASLDLSSDHSPTIVSIHIQRLVSEKRRARGWQQHRSPQHKARLRECTTQLRNLLASEKTASFKEYLENLDATSETNYSLWRAARNLKRPVEFKPPYAIQVEIGHEAIVKSTVSSPPHPVTFEFREVQNVIANLNPKKAPGIDGISNKMMIELPRVAVRILLFIFNAMLRLEYFPNNWKVAVVKMIPKPDHQFGFRRQHSTIEQTHRLVQVIRSAFEQKSYCSALFIDVSQAFDKVWHEGLILKLKLHLPTNIVKLLENYITSRKFVVKEGEFVSLPEYIASGVPQGSILGPLLYLIYTSDMPVGSNIHTSTFADDTACLSTHKIPQKRPDISRNIFFSLNNG
ncbi:Probable RNA-directed DNA polymerase from transposon X-element [Eumeta japonica]|uniref:Probable RNA-directed DNA polymerase from transposon X-element n=1 Tax=Eumeta variegata TaxID=151549 RepID=A0A4C1TNR6_EUMVA|nr:Probable RNA-directed DNA polymerase from transposon X-element [Eumeta japonica]